MESKIAKYLDCKFDPIVLVESDSCSDDMLGPKSPEERCVMSFVAETIANRKTTYYGRDDVVCLGLFPAFGWGSGFETEADRDSQATFTSRGVDSAKDREAYIKSLEGRPPQVVEMFKEGERIFTDFETACEVIDQRPMYDGKDYMIFKGIENLKEDETPLSVVFTLNPLELTAFVQINSSFRVGESKLLTPQASGCQAIGCFTIDQGQKEDPAPILSPIDFTSKMRMRNLIPDEYLCVSVPWKLFLKLEEISDISVLNTKLWQNYKK